MINSNDSLLTEKAWHSLPFELDTELKRILDYWEKYTQDFSNGGFYGQISEENIVNEKAPKGSVLNTRILWTFSASYQYTRNPRHLEIASRAFNYIHEYLWDPVFGGLFWSVDYRGKMLDHHKQVYAQAFGIYGLSEYYRVTGNKTALEQALELRHLIEKFSSDPVHGGYVDAFARDWSFLADKRLSAKDENTSKTMNTHLHIVEAYANLFEVWPDADLKKSILQLLNIFDEKIINKTNHHLGLFFSDDWKMDTTLISYGHDIEAGWLLQSCAESIREDNALSRAEKNAILITDAAMEGMDTDGGLWYEFNTITGKLISEKHWWPQAEALIGLCNAWQISGNIIYKNALLRNWQFIKHAIINQLQGEWIWGIDKENKQMPGQDKTGIWKCPYHNCRACLELLKRIKVF